MYQWTSIFMVTSKIGGHELDSSSRVLRMAQVKYDNSITLEGRKDRRTDGLVFTEQEHLKDQNTQCWHEAWHWHSGAVSGRCQNLRFGERPSTSRGPYMVVAKPFHKAVMFKCLIDSWDIWWMPLNGTVDQGRKPLVTICLQNNFVKWKRYCGLYHFIQ